MQQHMMSFFLLLYAISPSSTIKCYVCGQGAYEPFKFLPPPQPKTCQRLQSSEEFIMECPHSYVGCITQINGTQTTRTCDILAINDCQTANGVKYCYCSTDFCNGADVSSSTPSVKDLPHVRETSSRKTENVESAKGDEKLLFSIKSTDVQNQSTLSKLTFGNVLLGLIAIYCSLF